MVQGQGASPGNVVNSWDAGFGLPFSFVAWGQQLLRWLKLWLNNLVTSQLDNS